MNADRNELGRIVGRIIDRDSGQPLYAVDVTVANTDISTKTDIRGRFTIANLQVGECFLQCSHPDYKTLSNLKVTVKAGLATSSDCQLICKEKIYLDEPVILLPLRLEIRKQVVNPTQPVSLAKYILNPRNRSVTASDTFRQFAAKSEIQQQIFRQSEYWIRWYPDEVHYITPVGKISEAEKTDWQKFYQVYQLQAERGSVKKLYSQPPYNLSIQQLEIFYGIRPGYLTDEELIKSRAYDEAARGYIATEGEGVREVLGWQDLENPEIRTAWNEFAKKYGVVRVRQIAKQMLDKNWDFDTKFPVRIKLEFLNNLDREEFTAVLRSEFEKISETKFSENVQVLVQEKGQSWLIIDGDRQKYLAKKAVNFIEIFNLEGEPSEPMELLLEKGLPMPTLPEEISLYAIKNGKCELIVDRIAINREHLRIAPTDLETAHWMTDFQVAIKEGMGVVIKEPEKVQQIDEADWLIAVGLNRTSDSRKVIEEIFRRNNAAGDLSILAQDSPTNNSESTQTPFTSLETDAQMYLQKTRMKVPEDNIPADIGQQVNRNILDAHRLAQVLKLQSATVSEMAGANLSEMTETTAMASLLWIPCSALFKQLWGNNFAQHWQNWHDCDNFFTNHVRARGTLPIIRIGENPYGILPVLSLRHWSKNRENQAESFKFELIDFLKTIFLELAQEIPTLEIKSDEDRQETLLEILRRLPVSKSVDVRKFTPRNPFDWSADPEYLSCPLVRDKTTNVTSCIDTPFPETAYLCTLNYINQPDFNPHSIQIDRDSPLLKRLIKYFLLLKFPQKTPIQTAADGDMVVMVDTAQRSNIRTTQQTETIAGKAIDKNSGKAIAGAFVHLRGSGQSVVTNAQGEFAFSQISGGDRAIAISHNSYGTYELTLSTQNLQANAIINIYLPPTPPTVPQECDIIANASKLLKYVHPDKLEILLLETLDLFSHRLDAWLTGLANEQLVKYQSQRTQAPPTGVYGWLEKPGQLNLTPPHPEFIQAPSVQQATTAAILRNAAINNGTNDNSGAFQINLSSKQIRKGLWYFEGLRQGHLSGELLGYRLERMIHEESIKPNSQIEEVDIFYLREKYPLNLPATTDLGGNPTSVLTIIDGEKFLSDRNTAAKFNEIKTQLHQIKDAAADIALCEVINEDSNVERRGGWLDFLDGDGIPPREEFIRSHRTGDIQGTKIFLPIMPSENLLADESVTNPRAIAEPILASFCESLMPNFGDKEVVVELTGINGTQTRPIIFFARELQMQPIDLVMGGIEELKLRVRYYLLSCWQQNNPSDFTVPSPFNILGEFPDFDTSDELLNEVAVKLVQPVSADDTLNIFTYVEKANAIANLIHKNQSKSNQSTVAPENISLVEREQLVNLDLTASLDLLCQRLKQILDRLSNLITNIVMSTSQLKRRHLLWQELQLCPKIIQTIKVNLANGEDVSLNLNQLALKLSNFMETDPDLNHLALNQQLPSQIEQIEQIVQSLPNYNSQIQTLFDNLISKFLELEKDFRIYLQNTASNVVSDANLRLFEISQFGLEKALTIFPKNPTVIGCDKIVKILDRLLSALIDKLSFLVGDSPNLKNYLQCLKIAYLYAREVNEIFALGGVNSAEETFINRLPLSREQINILVNIEFSNLNYFEPLLENIITRISLEISTYNFKSSEQTIETIIALLQEVTDKETMVILMPYLLKEDNGIRSEWQLNFSETTRLDIQEYLQPYTKIRSAISNIFSLFNIDRDLYLFADKRNQSIDVTDYIYLINSNQLNRTYPYLAFLLIDEWQEGIPNAKEITGIALRYEAPKTEAPNAMIIAVPPYYSSRDRWNLDLLADTLLETIELMQIRMVGSDELLGSTFLGKYLPALLFPPGEDGHPLFPSIIKLLYEFDSGSPFLYVPKNQLKAAEISKLATGTFRSDTPQIGNDSRLQFLGE